MSVLTMGRCAVTVVIAAGLALGPAWAAGGKTGTAIPATVAHVRGSIVTGRVRVPRGILAGVPTGGDPYFGSRPILYPEPPVVVLAPPVFVPPVFASPVFAPPPTYEWAPIDFGPCFVPAEHTSQLGYWGSCLESDLRQYYLNRPD
jgi:hypothetical protein